MLRLVLVLGEFRPGALELLLCELEFPDASFALFDVFTEGGELLLGSLVLTVDALEALLPLVEFRFCR